MSQDACTISGTYVCTLAARLFLSGRVTWNMLFSPKLMTCARRAAQGWHMLIFSCLGSYKNFSSGAHRHQGRSCLHRNFHKTLCNCSPDLSLIHVHAPMADAHMCAITTFAIAPLHVLWANYAAAIAEGRLAVLMRTVRLPSTISKVFGFASSASLAPPTHSMMAFPLPLHQHLQYPPFTESGTAR